MAATKDPDIEVNTFAGRCKVGSTGFTQGELRETIAHEKTDPPESTKKLMQNTNQAQQVPLRLHLRCGPDRREGWVNVDINPKFNPDLVAHPHDLPMLPDSSCSDIESCHLLEHLTLTQARAALGEWRRLIIPGGQLHIELPNLERCLALIGTNMNGFDLGMSSLFGYPPEVDGQGEAQLHKWGWTPETLTEELYKAGFQNVERVAITQTHGPAAKFDRDMRLIATVAAPVVAPVPAQEPTACLPAEPTEIMQVLAWPRYENQTELDQFFHIFARVLSGREDVNLNLRLDPKLDPNRDDVIAAIEASHARILGAETILNITLLEGEISPEQWRDLSSQVTCRIRMTNEAAPRDATCQVAAAVVCDAASLYSKIHNGDSCTSALAAPTVTASSASPTHPMSTLDARSGPQNIDSMGILVRDGAHPDHNLVKRIHALHPWRYPVAFRDLTVVPGLGSACDPDWLANRAACRATLLVEQVLRRIDFRGKSVLDLACNCGFWSSFYAQAGASSVLGMEGHKQHVEQARLYWESNGFLPQGKAEFFQGNISDEAHWQAVRAKGPFDVTLCAGILYHIPNYAEVLAWAAAITNEVLIIDTRVQDRAESPITEPGALTLNAIAETRGAALPDRQRLLETLHRLGFETHVLPVAFASEQGVENEDSYCKGARITIVAHKLPVGVPVQRQSPFPSFPNA
ncbi:MAG: methyltransferase domain-containing protein [bacterium]|nr:methyltransferase domain-containing protein [bacterium]